jgi:hypothetical protein
VWCGSENEKDRQGDLEADPRGPRGVLPPAGGARAAILSLFSEKILHDPTYI